MTVGAARGVSGSCARGQPGVHGEVTHEVAGRGCGRTHRRRRRGRRVRRRRTGSGRSDTQYLTSAATITDVTNEVVGSGSIAPHAAYALAFGEAPSLADSTSSGTGAGASTVAWPVETVDATVGQVVKAGDVLATADATEAKLQLAATRRR